MSDAARESHPFALTPPEPTLVAQMTLQNSETNAVGDGDDENPMKPASLLEEHVARILNEERTTTNSIAPLVDGDAQQRHGEHESLIAMLAHDLRTPLTSIKGFAQLLLRTPANGGDSGQRYAQIIVEECDRVASTLRDLVAACVDDELAPTDRKVDLVEAVQNASQRIASERFGGAHRVTIADTGVHLVVRGDAEQFTQAMANFLRALLRYSDEDSVVRVTFGSDGDNARVTGDLQGTDLVERIGHLFGVPSTGLAEQRGSGLGMYICKRFIESRGGRMWMEMKGDDTIRICCSFPAASASSGR